MNTFLVKRNQHKFTIPAQQIRWSGDMESLREFLKAYGLRLVGFVPDGL